MSLDVWLIDEGEEVYTANITHNLNRMADAAGIYECLWRHDEIGITQAKQIIPLLETGLSKLVMQKTHFEQFNSENGWGLWEHFVPFCAEYLQAFRDWPDAVVSVSR